MLTLKERLDVPIPKGMRTLRRDSRGYPVPYIVLMDKSGTPQFTINDSRKVMDCVRKMLCSICGKRVPLNRVGGNIEPYFWFVGGSRCFLHPHGAFLDPPLHLECAEYALQVCPFLAASRYMRRIDDAKLKPRDTPEGMAIAREEFVQPSLPERFGLGLTHDFDITERGLYVVHNWSYVEWWRGGERIEAPETGEPPPNEEITA